MHRHLHRVQVTLLREKCQGCLAACPRVSVPLAYGQNGVTCPPYANFPPGGPLNIIEVCCLPSVVAPVPSSVVLASESAAIRREWILQLKSRLRLPRYIDTLRQLYLEGQTIIM